MHLNIRPFDARVQSVRVPSFEIDGLTPSSSRGFMGGAHVSIPSPPRALIALRALQATTPFPIRSNASSLLEYDSRWKRQLALRPEPTPVPSASISSLARQSSYGDAVLRALVNFNVVSIKAPDFFERRCIWLAEILRSVRGDATTIVDIGAGSGKNLPSFILAGFSRIVAIEPTRYGCQALVDMGKRLGRRIDVVQAELPRLPLCCSSNAILFTNHVLEQLPGQLDACIDSIISAGCCRVVNIEPSFSARSFLCHPVAELIDAAYRRRRHYSSGLSINLLRRVARGEISILHHRSCGYSPRVINVPTLAIWEPKVLP